MKRAQGFSLIEIMVVVFIIGTMMAIVAPNIIGSQEDAMKQKAVSDITQLESSLDLYKLKTRTYPTTEQGLQALVEMPTSDPVPRNYPDEGFIKRLPLDPWNNEYQLVYPGEMGRIDVFSAGPDGEIGTDDDIGNWNLDEHQQ